MKIQPNDAANGVQARRRVKAFAARRQRATGLPRQGRVIPCKGRAKPTSVCPGRLALTMALTSRDEARKAP